jgi:hypothetical protein
MGRTYTGFVEGNLTGLPWQAVVMTEMVLSGPTLTLKELSKKADRHIGNGHDSKGAISQACGVLITKEMLQRQERGIYRITPKGRKVWERVLDKQWGKRYSR